MVTPIYAMKEPPACAGAFSTEVNGMHYLWRGEGPAQTSKTVAVFDSQTEQWALQTTTGPPPPGLYEGKCASVGKFIYFFGGNCNPPSNTLYKLDTKLFQWTKVDAKNDISELPIRKFSFGFVSVHETTLCCFGGYGVGAIQSGSVFTTSTMHTDGSGWTNEFHLFNIKEGIWSSPKVKGDRPPPYSAFSFTKVDLNGAVLFGGKQPYKGRVNNLYFSDFKSMEVTKVECRQGDSWPEGRSGHAACCLSSDKLLVSGGLSNDNKVLGDLWILDVDRKEWTQVILSQTIKSRYWHSVTATCLVAGLTEILVFGGRTNWTSKIPISETTLFRFESSSELNSEKWALVDIVHSTIGSSSRLREKEKIKLKRLEQQLHKAEQKVQDADRRAAYALQQRQTAEECLKKSNSQCEATLKQLAESESRLSTALQTYHETKQRAVESERELAAKIHRLQQAQQETERRARLLEQQLEDTVCQKKFLQSRLEKVDHCLEEAEQKQLTVHGLLNDTVAKKKELEHILKGKTKELAAHNTEVWSIPTCRVSTARVIGSGGWGEVLEGTVKVAIKRLHTAILSQRNLERLQREMRLLAEVRHPNLVQFIGAVFNQSPPLIITELLDINLRQAYEQNQLEQGDRLLIFKDIARALEYLHQRYEPIIHRDVSAPNVLLQRMPNNQWKGKVSDLGSANFLQNAQTMGEGAIVYSPPEVIPQSFTLDTEPPQQTTKIDIYSYGIVVCEVTTSCFPSQENYREMLQQVQRDHLQVYQLIMECTKRDPSDRPTMAEVIVELERTRPF